MTKEMLAYEDTLKDIEKTLGAVPSLMKFLPEEKLIHDWPSWKRFRKIDLESATKFCIQCRKATLWKGLGEIDMERVRFLLSTDEMIEEMLNETQDNILPTSIKHHASAEVAQEDSA
jgi:predicted nucleotidyltransferase